MRDGGTVDFHDVPPIQGRRRRRLHSLIAPAFLFINTKDGSHEKSLSNLCRCACLPRRPNSATPGVSCSPIVIDLGNNGIHLGQAGVGVYFDVNADGVRDHVQWVRRGGDEGFLALDRSGNGLVDDGAELFGVGTPLVLEGRNAPNGFVGLAQYDSRQLGGNDDGLITEADAIWPQLRIWVDLERGWRLHRATKCARCEVSASRRSRPFRRSASTSTPRATSFPTGRGPCSARDPAARSWSTCSSVVLALRNHHGHQRRTSATRESTLSLRKIWRTCDLTVFAETPRRRAICASVRPSHKLIGHRLLGGSQRVRSRRRRCSTQVSETRAAARRRPAGERQCPPARSSMASVLQAAEQAGDERRGLGHARGRRRSRVRPGAQFRQGLVERLGAPSRRSATNGSRGATLIYLPEIGQILQLSP